jgi:hypothetical protein
MSGRHRAALARHRVRWLARGAGAAGLWVLLCAAVYLAVPPHAAMLASARVGCAPLPRDAYQACTAPVLRDLLTWNGRGLLAGVALAVTVAVLHPWWERRRGGLVPIDSPALRAELTGLSEPGREPTWLLAPYSYSEGGRAFGLPWRPFVRIDVGLGILHGTDPGRFRSIVAGELERLRHRSTSVRCLSAGLLLTAVAATSMSMPARHPASAIDGCLIGFWSEAPVMRARRVAQGGPEQLTWVARRGAVWSFGRDGTATLYLGDETIRTVDYKGAGSVRWRVTTRDGWLDLAAPVVAGTVTGPDGSARAADPEELALPGVYTCEGDSLTAAADLSVVELRRIPAAGRA